MAFFALGDVVAAALFQTGRFTYGDAVYVWAILAGSSIGLLATTLAPPVFVDATTRCAIRARHCASRSSTSPSPRRWVTSPPSSCLRGLESIHCGGRADLTAAASIGGWVELILLRRSLNARIGHTGLPVALGVRLWSAPRLPRPQSHGPIKMACRALHPIAERRSFSGPFGGAYLGLTMVLG